VVRPLTRFASADLSAIVVISPAPSLHQPTQGEGEWRCFLFAAAGVAFHKMQTRTLIAYQAENENLATSGGASIRPNVMKTL
jgi:hypothetical protein